LYTGLFEVESNLESWVFYHSGEATTVKPWGLKLVRPTW